MAWGAVISTGASLYSSYQQSKSAGKAASAQQDASAYSADVQYNMWDQMRQDFAPYLNAGTTGLASLQSQMPVYMQNTLIPAAQQLAGYQSGAMPSAAWSVNPITGQISGTGQQPGLAQAANRRMTLPTQQTTQPILPEMPAAPTPYEKKRVTGQLGYEDMPDLNKTMQQALLKAGVHAMPSRTDPTQLTDWTFSYPYKVVDTKTTAAIYKYMRNPDQPPPQEVVDFFQSRGVEVPNLSGMEPYRINPQSSLSGPLRAASGSRMLLEMGANGVEPSADTFPALATRAAGTAIPSVVSQQDLETGGVLSPTVPEFQRPMDLSQYAFQSNAALPNIPGLDYTLAGAPMPEVPELSQALDYQFDVNNPVYQQKLAEKNREIDKFLARQNLQGSSAGESFRQNELNKLLASEEERQYGRAVEAHDIRRQSQLEQYGMGMGASQELYGRQLGENQLAYQRALGERDYMTQTDLQRYGLEAARGSELYNRIYGQQGDLYGRMVQAAMYGDQQALAALQRQYGVSSDIYNTMYGSAQNLANYGLSAAGQTGQLGTATGQGISQASLAGGEAAAQGALAQGQAWAGFGQAVGQIPYNYYAQQAMQQGAWPSYYSGSSGLASYPTYYNTPYGTQTYSGTQLGMA